MNNGQQLPPTPPPLPHQKQPMPQYAQQPIKDKKKKSGSFFLYAILAIIACIIISNIMGKCNSKKYYETLAAKDSVFIDQADSILHAVPVKEFGIYLEKLQLLSLGVSKAENKKLVAENGIRAGKLLDSKETEWRELYVKKLKNELWEHNVEVEVSGKTITFIGVMFANNANIKKFHESAANTLTILGFKQVRYKWIKHDDEYQYFNL